MIAWLFLARSLEAQPQRPVPPIAAARADLNQDFVPDRLGDIIEVIGIATTARRNARDTLGFVVLQDSSAAIRLIASERSGLLSGITRGDVVRAVGTLRQHDGRDESYVRELERVAVARAPHPRPVLVIDLLGERYSEQLVQVSGQLSSRLSKKGERVFEFKDRSGAIDVRIPGRILAADTAGRLARGGALEMIAIASQDDETAPFDSGYRLAPRDLADFDFAVIPPYDLMLLAGIAVVGGLLALRFWLGHRAAVRRAHEMERLSEGLQRSEDALRVRNAQLGAIVEIQRDVAASAFDLTATMERIARHAQRLARCDGAAVGLRGREARYSVGCGICVSHTTWLEELDVSASGDYMASEQIVRCDDVLADNVLDPQRAANVGFRSALILPLIYGGRAVGQLALVGREPSAFKDDIQHGLQYVAGLFAAALSHALEFEAKQAVIDERTCALNALRESDTRFRSLIENSSDPIAVLDGQGRIQYASPAHERALGYRNEKLVGESAVEFVHPADQDAFLARFQELLAHPDRTIEIEFRFRHKEGDWRTLAAVANNLLGDPSVSGVVFNSRDVSERQLLEQQLRQAQKMEAVGQLAGGVAHDFNNLITVIIAYADLLLASPNDSDDPHVDLQEIKEAAERAATLTRQLLAFSRKQLLQPRVLDLNEAVAGFEPMLRRLIGEDIRTHVVAEPNLGSVMADRGQMEQVIMNLAVNARDAMPHGGTLTITTANTELDESYGPERGAQVPPGRYVMLAVSDTGCGMSTETQARIFEPFFTTKAPGNGTGLGLSTVYGIVKQSAGFIWCYSEPGRGTTFKLYLPRINAVPTLCESTRATSYSARCAETVLLVEDEEAVQRLASRVLRRHGYAVLEAQNGRDALRLASQTHIDLVLTDMVMPEISGRELAEQLRARIPDLRVLYMSGYTTDDIIRRGLLDPSTAFLEKPFTAQRLAAAVRDALDAEDYVMSCR